MIYQVKCDNNLLYDLREKELFLEEPVLNLEVNKIGTFEFIIYPDHPYFDKLTKLKSKIEVFRNGRTLFRGRIISDTQGLYNSKNIVCESALSFLNDSFISPREFIGTPAELFELLINNHNSQVSEWQKLKIGNVTVTDPNNYIHRSWDNFSSTLDILNTRCLEGLGGYFVERYQNDGTYIDWLADFNSVAPQTIEFGKNLMDIYALNDASRTYSVVIPIGADIEQNDGTFKKLTIGEVNNNIDYLVNQEALNLYGWIVAPVSETTWPDVTIASNLKTKGQNFLNQHAVTIKSDIELTALDLSACDANIEAFFIYQYVNIISKPHNFSSQLLLKKITIPFMHPEEISIILGETRETLTGINLGNKQNIDNVINRVEKIEADYVTNVILPNIINNAIANSSIISQLPNQIMASVESRISTVEQSIDILQVEFDTNNLVISVDEDKKPFQTASYTIDYKVLYQGGQVTCRPTTSNSYTGINVSISDSQITFSVNSATAITLNSNKYTFVFSYTSSNNDAYSVVKTFTVTIAQKGDTGANGTNGTNGIDGTDGKDAAIQSTTAPADTTQLWYDITNNKLKRYDGNDWIVINDYSADITQLRSDFTLADNQILLELAKKINGTDITKAYLIQTITGNQSSTKIGSDVIELSANDILNLIAGNTINLTSKNIQISATNCSIDANGDAIFNSATLNNAVINGGSLEITKIYNNNSYKISVGNNKDGFPGVKSRGTNTFGVLYSGPYIGGSISGLLLSVDSNNNEEDSEKPYIFIYASNWGDGIGIDVEGTNESTYIRPGYVASNSFSNASLAEKKKNIELFSGALELLENSDIYSFNWKTETDSDKKHYGLVIGEDYRTPNEFISLKGDGIDTYAALSITMQAIKEFKEQHDEEIKELREEIEKLKERLK